MGVPYTFGTATTSIPLSQLDANFNTPVTLGNTTVGLGNTVTTVGNLTLTNVTITSGTINAAVVDSGYVANSVVYANSTGVLTAGSADFVFNGTNVGIGTSSPDGKLNVFGGSLRINNSTTGSSSGLIIGLNSNDVFISNQANGYMLFGTNNTERMRIDSSGNVGIGTSSPSYKFVVNGSSTDERVYFQNTNAAGSQYFVVSAATGRSITTFVPGTSTAFSNQFANPLIESATVLNLSGITDMRMFTQNTERMRIDSSGVVGINAATNLRGNLEVRRASLSAFTGTTLGNIVVSDSAATADYFIPIDFAVIPTTGTPPIARIAAQRTSSGSYLYFGTSNNYASGITNSAMVIDYVGNVGIGTSSPQGKLDVSSSSAGVTAGDLVVDTANKTVYVGRQSSTSGDNSYLVVRGRVNGSGTNQAIAITGDTTAYGTGLFRPNNDMLGFSTLATERMRIDSSGNLLVGTTSNSGSYRLIVNSGSASETFSAISSSTTGTPVNINNTSSGGYNWNIFSGGSAGSLGPVGSLIFRDSTNGVTRALITSGGEVYIAGTTDQGAYNLQCNGTGVWGAGAYVNGSDERIKDDIEPLDSGLDVVAKLNPVTYKYKEDWSKDQSTQTGFIAQELLTALKGKNYVDGVVQQGGEYMSVAYQNIIPILTKAIQEQQAMIENLQAEVALLKSK